MDRLRRIARNLPTLLLAFVMAAVVWALAVNSIDPSVEKVYPNPVTIEVIGQAPNLVITNELPETISVTLRAPNSTWNSLLNEKAPVRAIADLSGLSVGPHVVPVQIQIGIRPVEITSQNPRSVNISLEQLETRTMTINVEVTGELAIGYQADPPVVSMNSATISGPASLVERVNQVKVVNDISGIRDSVVRSLPLVAVDENGTVVNGVSINPEKVTVSQNIVQRGGYRNLVVRVVTIGQQASGYRLTNIFVFPPTVTVFSSNPALVDSLPEYIETQPFDLTGLKDDIEIMIGLKLPAGIELVGDQQVRLQVGVAAIESSLALTNVTIEPTGLAANLVAQITPNVTDVIIGGPLGTLETVKVSDLRVLIDLTGKLPGKYTISSGFTLNIPDLRIDNLIPASFEVVVYPKGSSPPP
ncbi:MAG: CdaR family protein [Anaerolineaceae bacterium]